MKKLSFIFIFILLTIIMLFSAKAEAQQITINGKTKELVEVNLNINGKPEKSNTPSFVFDGITYVPVRFVSEKMGYRVEWIDKTLTVGIYDDKKIWFPIGKNFVNLQGTRTKTPNGIMALLLNLTGGKNKSTYVPVRYLSEYMGKKVSWDQATMTVSVSDKGMIDQKINSSDTDSGMNSETADIITGEITNPLPTEVIEAPKDNENIEDLTLINQTSDYDSSTYKMIFTFNTKVNYEVKVGNTSTTIVIKNGNSKKEFIGQNKSMIENSDMYVVQKSGKDLMISFNKTKGEIAVYKSDDGKSIIVTDTFLFSTITKDMIDGKESIVIKNMGKQKYNKMILESPKRIILDFLDSNMDQGNYKEFNIETSFVKKVRTSQFIPDKNYKPTDRIVRVVFDIAEGIEHPNLKISTIGNDLIVTPERSLYDNFVFRTSGTNRYLTIKGADPSLNINYDAGANIVTVPVGNLVPDGSIEYNDSLIKDISVKNGMLTLNLLRKVEVNKSGVQGGLTLEIKRIRTGNNSDYFILLDPGHGGTDPGAIDDPSGTKEVDIIMPIQRLLEQRLKAMGFRVQKTNNTVDSYVELQDRTNMSNSLKPDVFISIHANKADSKSAQGLEVYYYETSAKEPNQKEFGEEVVKAIESQIGKTRGLKKEKFFVIKNTIAPAILIETGFISNDTERTLLLDPNYQSKIVDGIIEGIENFLEAYRWLKLLLQAEINTK